MKILLWSCLLIFHPVLIGSGINHPFLARVTFYSKSEDKYSAKLLTSTGAKLEQGIAAVDPKVIPYHSKIVIPGLGIYTAEDTGSAVVSRKAARLSAKNYNEWAAPVIDVYTDDLEKHRKDPEYMLCWVEFQ